MNRQINDGPCKAIFWKNYSRSENSVTLSSHDYNSMMGAGPCGVHDVAWLDGRVFQWIIMDTYVLALNIGLIQ